jgi:superfamily II DNA or RNA helicase
MYIPQGVTGSSSDGVLTPKQQFELDCRQEEAAERIRAHWRGPHAKEAHPMVALPTGFGKGRIVHKLLPDNRKEKVLVIVGGLNLLLQQTQNVLADLASQETGESNFSVLPNTDGETVLGTWQSLKSCLRNNQQLSEFGLVIVDEVHEVGTTKRLRLLDELGCEKVAGLTATAFRSSGDYQAPHEYGFQIVDTMPLPECIRKQWLSSLVGISVDTKVVLPADVRTGLQFRRRNLGKALAHHPGLFEWIADDLANRFVPTGMKIIGVVNRINQEACAIATRLQSRGVKVGLAINQGAAEELSSRFVTADAVERYKLPHDDPQSIQVLLSPRVISVGFDAPATECVAWLAPTLSAVRYTQVTGRGARRCLGKRYCVVLDYVYTIEGFGYSQNFAQFFRQEDMVELEKGVMFVGPDDAAPALVLPTAFLDQSRAVSVVDLRKRIYQLADDWVTASTIATKLSKSQDWVEKRIAEHFPNAGEIRLAGNNNATPYVHYPPIVADRLAVLIGRYPLAGDWLTAYQIAKQASKSPQWVKERLNPQRGELRLDVTQNICKHYPPEVYGPVITEAHTLPKAGDWLTAHQIAEKIGKSDNWVKKHLSKNFPNQGKELLDALQRPYIHYHPETVKTLKLLAENEIPAGDWLSVIAITRLISKVRKISRRWVENRIADRFVSQGELRLNSSGSLDPHYPPNVADDLRQEVAALPVDAGDWLTPSKSLRKLSI